MKNIIEKKITMPIGTLFVSCIVLCIFLLKYPACIQADAMGIDQGNL